MRSTLMFLALACGQAFCQDNTAPLPDALHQALTTGRPGVTVVPVSPNGPLPAKLAGVLNPPAVVAPRASACSVPLLSAAAPVKPVPMPGSAPRSNPLSAPRPIDRMSVVAPAPACRADTRLVPAPSARPVPPPPPAKP